MLKEKIKMYILFVHIEIRSRLDPELALSRSKDLDPVFPEGSVFTKRSYPDKDPINLDRDPNPWLEIPCVLIAFLRHNVNQGVNDD